MDRPSSAPPPPTQTETTRHRDMMFCHECHDEWYRDEHGIFCPECGSEFTEIIEEGNDPRDSAALEHDHSGDDDSMPSHEEAPRNLHPLQDHNPWRDNDDPDEADISGMQFRSIGPGRYQVSATIHRTISPADFAGGGNGPNTIGGFASLLAGLIGGGRPPGQQPNPANQAGQSDGNAESRSDPGRSGPHIHRFQYTAGARLHPRDPDHPEPRLEPVDDINNVLAGLMAAFGEPPGVRRVPHGDHDHIMVDPINPILGLFAHMSGGQSGDFVYSQAALDRIITQLMEQTATSNAPGPASQEDINSLPRKTVTEEMLGAEGRAECSICMDEVNITEEVTELPCKHWFHHQCVAAWLSEHDTCPHCRKGITKPGENAGTTSGANPAPADASSSHTDPTSTMPGSFGVTGHGTVEDPFIVPGFPGTAQPPPSTNPNPNPNVNTSTQGGASEEARPGSGGGITDRIRRGLFGPPSR